MCDYILSPGANLAGWEIQNAIGRGGFSEVYIVRKGESEAALKLLTNPQLNYRDHAHEIMNMGIFNNKPYFVQFYGADLEYNPPFILMEYMPYGDLRRKIKNSISTAEAIQIVVIVACALQDMHKIGIVHRDVSPENIFLGTNHLVKLGDMGTALAESQLETAQMVAKISYAAPEVFRGGYLKQSDIYSLGVVLFELLGGNPRNLRKKPYEAADTLEVNRDLKKCIKNMCHYDPEKRFSADDIIKHLSNFIPPADFKIQTISSYYGATYTTTSSQSRIQQFRSIIFDSNCLLDQKIITAKQLWKKDESEILSGCSEHFKEILYKSFLLSITQHNEKDSNCYIGIEHILWTILDEGSMLGSAILKQDEMNEKINNIMNELFSMFHRIEYFPTESILTNRLNKSLNIVKDNCEGEATDKDFVLYLLETNQFFRNLLNKNDIEISQLERDFMS